GGRREVAEGETRSAAAQVVRRPGPDLPLESERLPAHGVAWRRVRAEGRPPPGSRVATCRGTLLAAEANAIAVTSGRIRFGAPSARAGTACSSRATIIAASPFRAAARRVKFT